MGFSCYEELYKAQKNKHSPELFCNCKILNMIHPKKTNRVRKRGQSLDSTATTPPTMS